MPEDAGFLEIGGGIALYGAFTAWQQSKNLPDGLNSYNQNHQTPAQQQGSAQQGAQQGLSSSSATNNCPNCGKKKCKDLRDDIHNKIFGQKGDGSEFKGLLQRQQEQINGQYGPGLSHPLIFPTTRFAGSFQGMTPSFDGELTVAG